MTTMTTAQPKQWRTRLSGSEFRLIRLQEQPLQYATPLDTPERAAEYVRSLISTSIMYRSDSENFGVVFVTTRMKPIGMEIISNGTLDTLLIDPRAVFKPAIVINASAIILWHNHPSGDPTPSEADITVTRDLIRAGQLLKINVLDHVILGQATPDRPKDYMSLRELGYFYS